MQFSHSSVETFNQCPYKWHLRYREHLKVIDNYDADNPLILGTAVHTCLEKGLSEGINQYLSHFPVLTDEQENEIIKLETIIPKIDLPQGGEFEIKLENDDFLGFIDYLVPVEGTKTQYDLYDFKYSNNVSGYMDSGQLHEYKYFFESCNPRKHIRNLYFVFVPKIKLKRLEAESLKSYRQRLTEAAANAEVVIKRIEFDYKKVADFLLAIKHINEMEEPKMKKGFLCSWCDYQDYCEKGNSYMLLPKNERRQINQITKKVMWIYGVPFSGKTTFANKFPDPLMLNTDGNIKFVDAPYIHIKDTVTVEGRMTNRVLAWDNFKEALVELEKKENTFKTIIVDLLEDMYEHCRVYMYNKLGIKHESDDSFKAWDMVRSEFLNTLKRLMNLDYENIILISHEDTTRDITKRSGDKVTAVKPNLAEKVANKVAGMVDIVARIGDNKFCFKNAENIFGGGRLKVNQKEIPLDYEEFLKIYESDEASVIVEAEPEQEAPRRRKVRTEESDSEAVPF